ncbi:hypothetical protein IGB42_04058 [Andreprevotia sp. IGB-42]|nr:hypothetical protein IGB42_04058 [Andreprevotia sp. IGB-42]
MEKNDVAYLERATQAEIDQRFHNMPFWAPKQIALLSFFFTPIFGAMLYLKNAQTIGDAYFINAAWRGLLTALIGAVLCMFIPGLYLVFYAVWFFTSGKEQMNLVDEVWGDKFVHKPWGKPIGIACGIFLALMGIAYFTRIYQIDWGALFRSVVSG